MKKYEMVKESKTWLNGLDIYRIRALIDIPAKHVRAGDLGGWVHCEENLSHAGSCWIDDEAVATEASRVEGDAYMFDSVVLWADMVIGDGAFYSNLNFDHLAKGYVPSWVRAYMEGYAQACDAAIASGGIIKDHTRA